jgi:hypothetical protein
MRTPAGKDLRRLALIWAVSQFGYYSFFGIRSGGDSGRYIDGAWRLIQQTPLTEEQQYYLAYEWLLATAYYFGQGPGGAVAIQCLLALIGATGLYLLGKKLFAPGVGLAASILYLLNPAIQRWNFYILTETLTTVALIATVGLAVLARETRWAAVPLLGCSGILAFSRPEGPFFLVPVFFYLLTGDRSGPALTAGLLLAGLFGLIFFVRWGMTQGFGLTQQWLLGTYIWGYPGIGPPGLAKPVTKDLSLVQLVFQSVVQDPGWVTRLSAKRVYYFLVPWRPYYSRLHNLAGLGIQIAAFFLALVGSRSYKNRSVLLLWLIFIIQLGLTALTWSDWDNRWADRVMPFVTLLAAAGGMALASRFLEKRTE